MDLGKGIYNNMHSKEWNVLCSKKLQKNKLLGSSILLGFFDQNEINKIMEESVKMKQFNHPNVMNLIGVCINAGPAPYIVMPFMANGSLLSYLRKERSNLILDKTTDEDLVKSTSLSLTQIFPQLASY